MFQFSDLRDQLATYLTQTQVEEISKAYLLANKAHEGQFRSTGEPYVTHPLEVARILSNMHMDYQSIVAAILHDVLEDTSLSKRDIAKQFGEKIAELVDGVSKLTQISSQSRADAQADNFRKMMMAMTRDIRVIIVKLADRLHNMRTLDALPRDKQKRIAEETLEIYAPIANRLGMNTFRIEFEDLGFEYLYPIRYRILKDAVKKARGNRREIVKAIESTLKDRLLQEKVDALRVVGREKHLYSLYKKMRSKDLSFSEIMDVYALRIIVSNVDTCYRVLGVVHNLYKPIHGRLKDYIAVPKTNGYQSLHTTVIGPYGVPIEIQIRTEEMDQMAENGIAAHWLYKIQDDTGNEAEARARDWLKGMLEIQKNTGSSLEFIEHVKLDLYPDEVYVFTPTGDILSLPSGATAVDFAYAVHTDVGNACIAAKLDRRLIPLSTRLSSGQSIEIITAEGAHPNPAWLSFVVTGKARSNIRYWLKVQQVSESRILGKRLLERSLASISLDFDHIPKESKERVLKELKIDTMDKLLQEIGLGNQMAPLVARLLAVEKPNLQNTEGKEEPEPLAIQGTEGMIMNYAKCCRPIPGDQIVGFLSTGRGMVIHREMCSNLQEYRKSPEKYIYVQWANQVVGEFSIEIRVEVLNQRGVLATIANAISECDANIENVYVDERDSRHNVLVFLVYVRSRTHLAKIFRKIRDVSSVTRVFRSK